MAKLSVSRVPRRPEARRPRHGTPSRHLVEESSHSSQSPGSTARGLVCLAPPNSREPACGPSHSTVSELAAWLHGYGWPVEIVVGNEPSVGLPRVAGTEGLGLGYRLRRLAPWLVHVFDQSDAGAARMAGMPYVLSVRAPRAYGGQPSDTEARRAFDEGLANARRVITPSRAAAKDLLENFGCESSVVPDGVDTERLRAVPARRVRPLVVCPSFEVDETDLKLLVDSFVQVVSFVHDAQLAIAGPVGAKTLGELIARMPERNRAQLLVLERADRKRISRCTAARR